jgi:hypothetical protein
LIFLRYVLQQLLVIVYDNEVTDQTRMLMLANRIPSECQADFSSHRRFHDLLLGLIGVRCCCNLHVN